MAKLTASATDADGQVGSLAAIAASLCVAFCMIVSLLGIKLWWFKHRLTFNHSSTTNGATGGAQPTMPTTSTSSSSKDKRAAQEFTDPNEVRGVFRKRTEDDLDIVRPVTLPPIRIKSARSTPSLLRPPSMVAAQRLQEQDVNATAAALVVAPPMQPPPPPPPNASRAMVAEAPQPKQQQPLTYAPPPSPPSMSAVAPLPPPADRSAVAPPAADEQAIFATCKQPAAAAAVATATATLTEATPAPLPRHPIDPSLDVVETTVPPEVLSKTFEAPKAPVRVQRSVSSGAKVDVRSIFTPMAATTEENNAAVSQSMETLAGDMTPHADIASSGRLKQQMNTLAQFNYAEVFATQDNTDGDGIAAAQITTYESVALSPIDDNQQQRTAPPRAPTMTTQTAQVDFQLREDPTDQTKLKWTVQRPNSFVRNDEELWQYLERQTSPISNENPTWLEMEEDIGNDDFVHTVEEEFNRIRHSYEINEADFLEINEGLNNTKDTKHKHKEQSQQQQQQQQQQKQQEQNQQPDGFGRTIDEDWVNFENLDENQQSNAAAAAAAAANKHSESGKTTIAAGAATGASISIAKVQTFEHGEVREVQTITLSLPERDAATADAAVDDRVESDVNARYRDHLDDGIIEMHYTRQVTFETDDDIEDIDISNSKRLKERRPTGYAQELIDIEEITDDEADEINKENAEQEVSIEKSDSEVEVEVKPKPRLKVTFDTNTEEHYLPADDDDDSDDDEDDDDDIAGLDDTDSDETHMKQMPKPMQRMTQALYTTQLNNHPHGDEDAAAMLFSSQVSLNEYDITVASDSWNAIRKNRYMAEELRRYSIQLDGGDEMLTPPKDPPPLPPPLPPPPPQPPVAAQRHPIPQTTTTTTMQDKQNT